MPTFTVKLTDPEAALLEQLRLYSTYKSTSSVLRQGLMTLAEQYKLKPGTLADLKHERLVHRPRYTNKLRRPTADVAVSNTAGPKPARRKRSGHPQQSQQTTRRRPKRR